MNSSSATGMTIMMLLVFSCLTTLFVMVPQAEAVWLTIPSSGTKCISEGIQSNVVILADYYVIPGKGHHHLPGISTKVTSPYGNNLHQKENVTQGQFAFTTAEGVNYVACFWMDGHHQEGVSLGIEWKTGISAKDWESVAKKEKIEGVELELMKLEGRVQAIHQYLIYLKDKWGHEEAIMRQVSERTNARVAWFSIMSLGVCIMAAALQLWYLKRFFRKKKLI